MPKYRVLEVTNYVGVVIEYEIEINLYGGRWQRLMFSDTKIKEDAIRMCDNLNNYRPPTKKVIYP